mmetsp:Transcript_372/g.1239  ORF Transcript_372/g.1239 Transcript_372/m.1239 type:complete len:717 (-) Transcript_372:925-3075(-)
MGSHNAEDSLFPVFLFAVLFLTLVPVTISRVRRALRKDEETAARSVTLGSSQRTSKKKAHRVFNTGNLVVCLLWGVLYLLYLWVVLANADHVVFDPFEILGVDSSATEKEVGSAYRQLSRQYHPDKNPDPEAQKYFIEKITPAYKALTDEKARANLEKYGHPDGPQAMKLGVALPTFLLDSSGNLSSLVLLMMVLVGIIVPGTVALCYISKISKYSSTSVLQLTLERYVRLLYHKAFLSVTKVPEVLVAAVEYYKIPFKKEHQEPVNQLRTLLKSIVDPKDPKFYKRHPAFIKAHLLILAHLERVKIPAALVEDSVTVLKYAPLLCDELMKVARSPMPPDKKFGWLQQALSVAHMSQCLVQGVSLNTRKSESSKATVDAGLLQLPGVDEKVCKGLLRKKVKNLAQLEELSESDRKEAMGAGGLSETEISDVEIVLASMPKVHVEAFVETAGEEDVLQGDLATLHVRVCVWRRLSAAAKSRVPLACAPRFPGEKEEKWWVLLADGPSNSIICADEVKVKAGDEYHPSDAELEEAEKMLAVDVGSIPTLDERRKPVKGNEAEEGVQKEAAKSEESVDSQKGDDQNGEKSEEVAESKGETTADEKKEAKKDFDLLDFKVEGPKEIFHEGGSRLTMRFLAPAKGSYSLTLYVLSDSWIGVDKRVNLKLKVGAPRLPEVEEEDEEGDEEKERYSDEEEYDYEDYEEEEEEDEDEKKDSSKK